VEHHQVEVSELRPVVLTFLTFFLTLNPINSRRKEKGFMQLSHIQLHEKKVTELLDKELKELKSLQGHIYVHFQFLRKMPIVPQVNEESGIFFMCRTFRFHT
jgi:hypothetical protein